MFEQTQSSSYPLLIVLTTQSAPRLVRAYGGQHAEAHLLHGGSVVLRPPKAPSLVVSFGLCLFCLIGCGGHGGSTPAQPDFGFTVSPGNLRVPAGGSGYATVTVTRSNGFDGPVNFALSGAPVGVSASGTVATGATILRLPIVVGTDTTPQTTSALLLTGQAGALTHTLPFSLTVAPALPPDNLSPGSVQAFGKRQTATGIENQGFGGEAMHAIPVQDSSGAAQVRPGFYPSATPQKP